MTKRSTTRRQSAEPKQKISRPTGLSPTQRDWLIGLFLLSMGLVTLLGLFSPSQSTLIKEWLDVLRRGVGWGVFAVPICLGIGGAAMIARATGYRVAWPWGALLAVLFVVVVGLALSHLFVENPPTPRWPAGEVDPSATGSVARSNLSVGQAGALVDSALLGAASGLMMTLHVTLNDVIVYLNNAVRALSAWWQRGAIALPGRARDRDRHASNPM